MYSSTPLQICNESRNLSACTHRDTDGALYLDEEDMQGIPLCRELLGESLGTDTNGEELERVDQHGAGDQHEEDEPGAWNQHQTVQIAAPHRAQ